MIPIFWGHTGDVALAGALWRSDLRRR